MFLRPEFLATRAPKSANQLLRFTDDIVPNRTTSPPYQDAHARQRAAFLGDDLIMKAHQHTAFDFQGSSKASRTLEPILAKLEEVRPLDRDDKTTDEQLRRDYLSANTP